MTGAGKSELHAVAASKEMEFKFGKTHCNGTNGGKDIGINAGAGGRRSSGYMEAAGQALTSSVLRKDWWNLDCMRDYPSRKWGLALSGRNLHLCIATARTGCAVYE